VAVLTLRLKEILASSLIGKVLSSEAWIYGNLAFRDGLLEGLTYFADHQVGGHPINIWYGHTIDFVHEVLGDWQDFHAIGKAHRPSLNVIGADGKITGSVKSDDPDYLSVHGTLQSNKSVVAPGATLVATSRLGPQFKYEPGFVWTVNGEKGELRLAAPGPYLQSGYSFDGPITIAHHDHATDKVMELDWDWPEWQKEYGLKA
jgi:predicted dehydrogenase